MSDAEVDFEQFIDHIRGLKPPFECPLSLCRKSYRSFSGMVGHLRKDHNYDCNADGTPRSPQKNRKSFGRKTKNFSESGTNEDIGALSSASVGSSLVSSRQVPMTYAESKKYVEVDFGDGKLFKLSILDPLDIEGIEENIKSPKKAEKEKPPSRVPVPEAKFIKMENFSPKRKVKMPSGLIDYKPKSVEELENVVEYDMDEEDEIWLKIINDRRTKTGMPKVSEEWFERLMDCLEKASHFQNQDSMAIVDEDAVCTICMSGDCENTNAILFCDMCNVAVHQECYGVPYIPEGQWLCRKCQLSPSESVTCALCPNTGGALKQTDDNRWAHVSCALWVPEVVFANTTFLEPIEGFDRIPSARWKLNCFICKQKSVGACIQCHKPSCYTAFHVTCAQQAGLYMKMEPVRSLSPGGGSNFTVKKTAFCYIHAPADDEGSTNGHSETSSTQSLQQKKKESKLKMRRARRLLAQRRNSAPSVSIPVIPSEQIEAIKSLANFAGKQEFFNRLYAYWTLKRRARAGVPLLRRLQVSSQQSARMEIPVVQTTAEQDAVVKDWIDVRKIRQELEKARMLCEWIKKREIKKQELIAASGQLLDELLQPINFFLISVLDSLQALDERKIFSEPVTDKDVPGYSKEIKIPMAFSTMRSKINEMKYAQLADMEKDFKLIIDNCLKFNRNNLYYLDYAKDYRKQCKQILDDAKQIETAAKFDGKTGLLSGSGAAFLDGIQFYLTDPPPPMSADCPVVPPKKRKPRLESQLSKGSGDDGSGHEILEPKSIKKRPHEESAKMGKKSPAPRSRSRSSKPPKSPAMKKMSSDEDDAVPLSAIRIGKDYSAKSPGGRHLRSGIGVVSDSKSESFQRYRNMDPRSPGMRSDAGTRSSALEESDDEIDVVNDLPSTSRGSPPKGGGVKFDDSVLMTIPYQHGDIVWAKCSGKPWFPAVVWDPEQAKLDTSWENGNEDDFQMPPYPPKEVFDEKAKGNFDSEERVLVWYFVVERWQWATKKEVIGLGLEKEVDKTKLKPQKKQDRPRVKKAYIEALKFKSARTGEPMSPGFVQNSSEESD